MNSYRWQNFFLGLTAIAFVGSLPVYCIADTTLTESFNVVPFLRVFESHIECKVSPEAAWKALGEIQDWYTDVSTVTAVEMLTPFPFLSRGTRFYALTPEKIDMLTEVTEVIPNEKIHMSARSEISEHSDASSILNLTPANLLYLFRITYRAELDAMIVSEGNETTLIWRQAYPGTTALITGWPKYRDREGNETRETLKMWARRSGCSISEL